MTTPFNFANLVGYKPYEAQNPTPTYNFTPSQPVPSYGNYGTGATTNPTFSPSQPISTFGNYGTEAAINPILGNITQNPSNLPSYGNYTSPAQPGTTKIPSDNTFQYGNYTSPIQPAPSTVPQQKKQEVKFEGSNKPKSPKTSFGSKLFQASSKNNNLMNSIQNKVKSLAGQVISIQNFEVDQDGNHNIAAIAERKEREANREQFEGEAYDPLKKLTEKQVGEYAKRGVEDYLTSLRISTKRQRFSKYDKLLKTLEVLGTKDFKDEDFPPELSSLVGENQAGRNSWKGLKWIRPQDIETYSTSQVIKGKIEPNDIRQGYLGDCYFLSSLASLAEYPNRIKELFKDNKQNPYGCHCVRICDKGEWKHIVIDEFFPCISQSRGPAFTKGNEGEIWVMLLEKAWAKVNGSYDGIEAGLTRECLHDFTGAPTQTLWLDEMQTYDSVWEKLVIGEKNSYAMTCGSNDASIKGELEKVGIISGHAYSLLGAYELDYQGSKIRLVKLRNPWGQKEWKGAWCDGDSKFSELSPQDLNLIDVNPGQQFARDDGIFFMEYDDFRKYYTDAQVCYIHDEFKYSSIKATSSKRNSKFFAMKVTKAGRYFVSINQKSKRKFPKELQKTFKYSTCTIVVAKVRGDGTYQYIEGQQKDDREVWTSEDDSCLLEPGIYYVYAKVQWRYSDTEDFVLSAYGVGEVSFFEITKVECLAFISEAYFDHAKNVSKRQKKFLQEESAWILVDQTDDGFFYLAVENNSNKIMNCEFKLNKMNGLKLRKPFKGQNVQIQLKPGKHQAAILRVKDYKLLTGLSVSQTVTFK